MGHDHIAHLQSNPKVSICIICHASRIVPWVEWSFPCRGSFDFNLPKPRRLTQLRVHFQENLNIIFDAWQQRKQTLQRGAKFLTKSLGTPDFSIEQTLCLVILLFDEADDIDSRNPNFVAPIVMVSRTVSERVVSPSTGQLQRTARVWSPHKAMQYHQANWTTVLVALVFCTFSCRATQRSIWKTALPEDVVVTIAPGCFRSSVLFVPSWKKPN